MKPNISKLRRKAVDSFVPVGESLRSEGATDYEITRVFHSHVEAKVKNYYSETKFNLQTIKSIFKKRLIKPPESKAEYIFYKKLIKEKISFKFQYKISPYRVDFLVNDFLIIEIDGPQHGTQKKYDKKRDQYLESYGYQVVRYPIWLIAMDVNAVINQIKEEIGKI